jgi:hypothetical protein
MMKEKGGHDPMPAHLAASGLQASFFTRLQAIGAFPCTQFVLYNNAQSIWWKTLNSFGFMRSFQLMY